MDMARRLLYHRHPLLLEHHHPLPSSSRFFFLPHPRFLSQQRTHASSLLPKHKPSDPGDWSLSPEWWGTQGRGWGHNQGSTLFSHTSLHANGIVAVTAHPSSSSGLEDWSELSALLEGQEVTASCEWRVLRFNNETRQSVAKVLLIQGPNAGESFEMQIPSCLAFEYLKSMVSVGLSSVAGAGLDLESIALGNKKMRCLCIGLGGGSLPLYLTNKLQGCHMDVVEVDKTVISAATGFMGFPKYTFKSSQHSDDCKDTQSVRHVANYALLWGGLQERIHGYEADGAVYLKGLHKARGRLQERIHGIEADAPLYLEGLQKVSSSVRNDYDIIFIDAFDGNDQVPSCFWSEGGSFLDALSDLLNPSHGTVVMNLHTDAPPPSLIERITGDFGPGFDPLLPAGRKVQEISRLYRDMLLPGNAENHHGIAFTVAVPRQQNICLTIARGIHGTKESVIEKMKETACHLSQTLKIPFPMTRRVSRGFHFVK